MRMNLQTVKMLQVSKCLIGLAVMMLQSCDVADNLRDMLCGNWESVEGDRKSTRLNSSHIEESRMPSSA